MDLHWIQHVPFEGLGSIATWAEDHGHRLVPTRVWSGDAIPDPEDVDFLVVMGGPMGAGDENEFEWLASEKRFISDVIERGAAVLGICLGAQLIASALGAEVTLNPLKEIGWFPVTLTADAPDSSLISGLPDEFMAFHWHGETFEIPRGALHVASSPVCANQAFTVGDRVVALQFHLETLPANVDSLIENCADELIDGEWIQSADEMRASAALSKQTTVLLDGILDRMAAAATSARSHPGRSR